MFSSKVGTCLLNCRISTLKMETANSYETSVTIFKLLDFQDKIEAKDSSEILVIICQNSGLLR
jgi:hypothetical protein